MNQISSRGEMTEQAEGLAEPGSLFLSKATNQGMASETETILLVEDEVFVREVTSEVLRSAGYRVLTAKTADEAAQTDDQQLSQVDLLLTDVILPGKSGRTLANDLKQRYPWIAVLLVSGYMQQWTESEAGGWTEECLPKPFSATVLLLRVREALNQQRSRRPEGSSLRRACDGV
jgi:two-component system, cell cycle sensor histidine kinase and response regulator CckA